MAKPKALGRGLGDLISGGISPRKAPVSKKTPTRKSVKKTPAERSTDPENAAATEIEGTVPFPDRTEGDQGERQTGNGLFEIPVHKIVPNPHQPRKHFGEDQLNELAESIRSEGLLQPIVVRAIEDGFELIAGERRWRACQQLKLKFIPARILQATESSSAVLSLIENLQRADLDPIEEAMGFASLIRDFDLTQEAVSNRVGRSRASVANSLRLLQLPGEIQGFLSRGILSVGHAKVLLGVEDEGTRLLLARQVIERSWSVRELERQASLSPRRSSADKNRNFPQAELTAIRDLEKQMAKHLSTAVQLKHSPKKGKIIIDYHGNEDLQRILEQMGLAN